MLRDGPTGVADPLYEEGHGVKEGGEREMGCSFLYGLLGGGSGRVGAFVR
jgi:hypothetical protein